MERQIVAQSEAREQDSLAKNLHEMVRACGYTQFVMMVDRDGVVLPEDLVKVVTQRASFESQADYYLKAAINRVRPNLPLTLFLEECDQAGIQVCPGSRTDWLFSSSETCEVYLHEWWNRYHRRFNNSQVMMGIKQKNLLISGLEQEKPFVVFISNDFTEQDKFSGLFNSLILKIKETCPDFQLSSDFMIMPVPNFGTLISKADTTTFSEWPPNYNLAELLMLKTKRLMLRNR